MQSRVDVGGTVRFIENSAVNGGGLALEDQCLVNMPYAMKFKLCNVMIILLFSVHYRFTYFEIQRCTSTETQLKWTVELYTYEHHPLPLIPIFFPSLILAALSSTKWFQSHFHLIHRNGR